MGGPGHRAGAGQTPRRAPDSGLFFPPAQHLQNVYEVLKWTFTVFPQFCLGQGLVELCYNQVRHDLARSLGVDAYASPFAMSFLGWVFVQLASQGTVLLLLRVLLHRDLLQGPRCVRRAVLLAPSWNPELPSPRLQDQRAHRGVLVSRALAAAGALGQEEGRELRVSARRALCRAPTPCTVIAALVWIWT